jgi:mannose-6-phosphate isomerase-like protein (cupin superfamily)
MNELELIRSFGRNDTTPNSAARAAARSWLLAHIADDRSTTNPSGQFPTWLPDVITAAAEGLANEDALARKQISSDVVTVQQVVRCLPADIAATQKMRDRPRTSPGNADLSYLDRLILKPWGSEFRVYEDDFTDVWCVNIKPEHRTSLHCHLRKLAAILCLGGKGTLSTCSGVRYALEPGVVLQIEPGAYHRSAATSAGLLLIEIETPKDKLDLLCIEDDYRTSAYAYEDEHHIPLRIVEREHAVAGPRALQPFVEQHLAGNHRARLRAQDSTGYHFAVETGDQIRTSSYHLVFAIELQPGATTLRDLTVIGPQRVFTAVPGNVYLTIRPLKQ